MNLLLILQGGTRESRGNGITRNTVRAHQRSDRIMRTLCSYDPQLAATEARPLGTPRVARVFKDATRQSFPGASGGSRFMNVE
jgi:hypothetical protein